MMISDQNNVHSSTVILMLAKSLASYVYEIYAYAYTHA